MKNCPVEGCIKEKPDKYLLCKTCWEKLPKELRLMVGETEKKSPRTLRVNPTSDWIIKAEKYLGLLNVSGKKVNFDRKKKLEVETMPESDEAVS